MQRRGALSNQISNMRNQEKSAPLRSLCFCVRTSFLFIPPMPSIRHRARPRALVRGVQRRPDW